MFLSNGQEPIPKGRDVRKELRTTGGLEGGMKHVWELWDGVKGKDHGPRKYRKTQRAEDYKRDVDNGISQNLHWLWKREKNETSF